MAAQKPLKSESGRIKQFATGDKVGRQYLPNEWRDFYIPAGSFVPSEDREPTATTLHYTTSRHSIDVLNFIDSSANVATVGVKMPDAWDLQDINVKVFWNSNDGTTAQTCVWQVNVGDMSDGDNLDLTFGSTTTIEDDKQDDDDILESPAGSVDVGEEPGRYLVIKVTRDPGHVNDDLEGDAALIGIAIQYKESVNDTSDWTG